MDRELGRLRRRFEELAHDLPDLRLSVFILPQGRYPPGEEAASPNHLIPLWQFLGDGDGIDPRTMAHSNYGIAEAQLTAYALLEGEQLETFLRLAKRAGSMIPDAATTTVNMSILRTIREVHGPTKPIYSSNSNPVAVWLNLLLVAVSTFQPERFRHGVLAVDPFAGSLAVFDHILLRAEPFQPSGSHIDDLASRRFDVALSFPGERREYVREVAHELEAGGVAVFYDKFFEAELAQPDLDLLLQRIYRHNSNLVAVFLCAEYSEKEWCGLEWRAIRDLIKVRARRSVMPLRFDDTEVPGLFSIDGYIDLTGRDAAETAGLISRRVSDQGTV